MPKFAATPPMLLSALLLALLLTSTWAQQDPGMGYPLQLFRLAPSATALLQEPRMEAQRSTPAPADDDGYTHEEVGGFQAWDGEGRTAFGFLYPDQTRVEARDSGGSVAGAYSYLDKDGDAVKVQYWDSGSGFHVATNRLPAASLGLPMPPNDTPEVQAAREQHLQQVQAALLHHAHVLDRLEAQKPQMQRPQAPQGAQATQMQHLAPSLTPSRPPVIPPRPPLIPPRPVFTAPRPPLHAPALHQPVMPQIPEQVLSDEDGVVVESDGHQEPAANDDGELTRYPDLHQVPQALFDPSHMHDPYNEAVIVEAEPSAFDGFRGVPARRGSRPRHRAEGRMPKALASEEAVNENPSIKKKVDTPDRKTFMVWHTVPVYVEVKTVEDDPADPQGKKSSHILPSPSFSQKAAFLKAQPPAAVHSFQVPPFAPAAALQSQPLFISPHASALAAAPLSYSAKAAYFDAIPIAAVHDAQVHPLQASSVLDHQTRPLFHETPVNK